MARMEPTLMTLPWEIRRKIWELAQPTESEREVKICNCVREHCDYNANCFPLLNSREDALPWLAQPLLHVSRWVRDENLPIADRKRVLVYCRPACLYGYVVLIGLPVEWKENLRCLRARRIEGENGLPTAYFGGRVNAARDKLNEMFHQVRLVFDGKAQEQYEDYQDETGLIQLDYEVDEPKHSPVSSAWQGFRLLEE